MKPDPLFDIWRADEVAECLGVSSELYAWLWNDIVAIQAKMPEEPEDCQYGAEFSQYWHMVPDHWQQELNRLAQQYLAV